MRLDRLLQPIDGQAGEYLKAALSRLKGPGSRLVMVSAWVKLTGLSRIWSPLERFRGAGGHVLAIVGIDQRGTTREALECLMKATNEAYVFNDDSDRSFHLKFYLVSTKAAAVLLIGSGNLTKGGLYTNYELFDVFTLDLSQQEDSTFLQKVDNAVYELLSDPATAKPLDGNLLKELRASGLVLGESRAPRTRGRAGKRSPFGSRQGLPGAPPPQLLLRRRARVRGKRRKPVKKQAKPTQAVARVLVQLAPVSRGRPSQLGIAAKEMEDFFGLTPHSGATIELQQVQPGQPPKEWEERRLVFPEGSNRNRRIEVSGLRDIRAGPDRRPILVFEELAPGRYKYLILMPGDGGYPELQGHLQSLPPTRSMAHDTTTRQKLLTIWSSYPV